MKKILLLGFTLLLLGFLLTIKDNSSYAFSDCHNKIIKPKEITTLNLKDYVLKNHYDLISFCSFDMCYTKREDNINKSINNFKKLFDKYLSEDDLNELNVKGYPITQIIINDC